MAGRRGKEPQPGKEPEKPGGSDEDSSRLRDGYAEPTYQGRGRHRKPDKTDDADES